MISTICEVAGCDNPSYTFKSVMTADGAVDLLVCRSHADQVEDGSLDGKHTVFGDQIRTIKHNG